jgi:hypothetical protein
MTATAYAKEDSDEKNAVVTYLDNAALEITFAGGAD